ncbi:MAG: low-complexity protein [Gammaproteobacteria bacterium]|nr:low-complexity protein [Gammaproteobacteria bacterium]
MSQKKVVKPVALAVGAALAGSFALTGMATADTVDNPFAMSSLSAGYMLGAGEGACGGDKEGKEEAEGSCGEGSCGADTEPAPEKDAEGSCGEGSCGADAEPAPEKDAEGSCGEGSCGATTE